LIPLSPDPTGPSAFAGFLHDLFTSGDVRVGASLDELITFDESFETRLASLDEARRHELDALPALDPAVARWAAATLYRSCQLLVCRDCPAGTVAAILGQPCPGADPASAAYSADLFFIFLPDLFVMANQFAPADPLVLALRRLAREWPLSSVGIDGETAALGALADDPALLRLYADRVTAHRATNRLGEAVVRARLRADVGLFPALLPFPASTYEHA
jgi:hypothetical protein